ncbi:fasciclin domain-containing protein [Aquimarina sp. 2201CG5-10]|uniref:fasciclin domain-containing protein n=1 Tax=Aquimarina callyspongiae TaxID=3098150 RepID=UPI002AB36F2B|nr:fasciclin domain-containing protein [Aquimarina sp. 2201CG5-10]MDY8134473.1 fasciclin domain-containing protein [Aquimarina sp. 2201CG5-10]
MRFKTQISAFTIFGVLLLLTSCQDADTKKVSKVDKDKLIAQADIPEKEKYVPTLSEVISKDIGFSELNKIVETTDYSKMLKGKGPYTIFAPLNGALERLPPNMLDNLKKPENHAKLTGIINCHIISGLINKQDIIKAVKEYGGSVKLKTIGGSRLIASLKGDKIYLIDETGNAGRLMINDIEASNGIIHTIESVMMPKK